MMEGMPAYLYEAYEKLGWNEGRSFPLEKLFQKKNTLREMYCKVLQILSPLEFSNHGFNFLYEDWDYAIVLDACRFDVFKENNPFDETVTRKHSIASSTGEWVQRGITEDHTDKIIVSANPVTSPIKLKELTGKKNRFFKNIPAWDIGWSEKHRTVPPWSMTQISKAIVKKYPNKKIIFWYLQPHHPFLSLEEEFIFVDNIKIKILKGMAQRGKNVWDALKAGEVPIRKAKNGYITNTTTTLKYVKELIEHLNGKIIITSDHGNCFGEMGLFGHPSNIHIPPLIDVPYLEIKKDGKNKE